MRRFQIFDVRLAHRYIVVLRLKQIERKEYVFPRIEFPLACCVPLNFWTVY